MTAQTKIYIAAAVALAALIAGSAAWSGYRIRTLERNVERSAQEAGVLERRAIEKELEAAAYAQKIAYLERRITETQQLARRQDETLEKLTDNSGRVRGDLERARRRRSVPAGDAALCSKLAELGHPCE